MNGTCAAEGVRDAPRALEFDDVSFSYAGAEDLVLDHLSWKVPQGAFALLVGATGSGKSTALSLAKPEISPAGTRRGSVSVLGEDVGGWDAGRSARSVGYVFQNPENQIVCESVWHELAFGLENLGCDRGEMRRLIAETSYFFGIEDWFRSDTATLSGGRKQLLALAATLVMQPRVLLLDEPTAQLDPVAERNFLHALFRVNRELGCTVVVATHRPGPMVPYADCAWRMTGGGVTRVRDLAELSAREPVVTAPTPRVPREAAAASLSRAWFRYGRTSRWVLRGFDLKVREGGIHALVGGNGCGKSTILKLMAGLERPGRGSVVVAAPSRALLPQDPRALFIAESVEDELMEWSSSVGYGRAEAHAMLEGLGLDGLARRHPYDLSGGQQQLLGLGKLLLVGPRLLLLDEPTKGLDLSSRRILARSLSGLADDGAAVVMATHDLDFAYDVADEVTMVFDGEAACTAPAKEFFEGNVYYRP